jgi:hypothetical protein
MLETKDEETRSEEPLSKQTWLQRMKEKIFGINQIYLYNGEEYKYNGFTNNFRNWFGPTKATSIGNDETSYFYNVKFIPVNKNNINETLTVTSIKHNLTPSQLIQELITDGRIKEKKSGGKIKPKTKKSKKTNKKHKKHKKHRKTQRK